MHKCPTCGHVKKKYQHSLTTGLVSTLCKFMRGDEQLMFQAKHPILTCAMTYNQGSNFQKLRYFGLVIKSSKSGYWILTQKGHDFVYGKTVCEKHVITSKGVVESVSAEKLHISQLKGLPIEFQKEFNIHA